MSLTSGTYLLFLLVCLILHTVFSYKLQNFWLLLSSVVFCAHAMPEQTLILLTFSLVSYFWGRLIGTAKGKWRKLCLTIGILYSIAFLVFYKYIPFVSSILHTGVPEWIQTLIVPLGISYITFQCISYFVEIAKGNMEPEESPVDFLVYMLFFAKLTAGPIESPKVFLQQLKQPRACTVVEGKRAMLLLSMGFLKKIAVADVVAPCVNALYALNDANGWMAVLAIVLYAIQILFDFSGYTDIARGSAMLFGIQLTENFSAPYRAVSVRDFWKRWHISLSTWLRTYVFFPLGGSRVPAWRRCFNILAVFLVSGIWHGSSWNFVVWGLWHGLLQVIEILAEPYATGIYKRLGVSRQNPVLVFLGWLKTIFLVCIGWVFFRASSLTAAVCMLQTLLGPWGSLSAAMEICGLSWPKIFLTVAGMFCIEGIRKMLKRDGKNTYMDILTVCVMTFWAVALVQLTNLASGSVSSFIYFDF